MIVGALLRHTVLRRVTTLILLALFTAVATPVLLLALLIGGLAMRSEERRVGKECQ